MNMSCEVVQFAQYTVLSVGCELRLFTLGFYLFFGYMYILYVAMIAVLLFIVSVIVY